tara:strand:- start:333 stop:599 length:267 start_codon:yes stop_codon:yes gene_type:complete
MGLLQEFNINELAGATGLMLGALGALLAVIWKSRCHCKMNLCYLCQCERFPPTEQEKDSSDEEEVVPKKEKEKVKKEDKELEYIAGGV